MTTHVTSSTCPECGTPAGGDAPAPWWTRGVPLGAALVLLAVVLAVSIVRLERFGMRPPVGEVPVVEFVQPHVDARTLRAIAAGEAPAPEGFIDRLLKHAPQWFVQPPGPDELFVQLTSREATRTAVTEIGRPLPWLRVQQQQVFADLFRGEIDPDPAASGLPSGRWRWSRGTFVYWWGDGFAVLHIDALALPIVLLVMVGLLARWLPGEPFRRRRRRRIAVAVTATLFAAWTIADIDRGVTVRSIVFNRTMTAPPSPHRTPLTVDSLRELRDDPQGSTLVAAAIADIARDAADDDVLCAGFVQRSLLKRSGWRFGWPLDLLVAERVQRDMPTVHGLESCVWRPGPTRARLAGKTLSIVVGDAAPTDRLRVLHVHIASFAAIALVAMLAWWSARRSCLAALSVRRSRRAGAGLCLVCAYPLARGRTGSGSAEQQGDVTKEGRGGDLPQ